MRRRASCAWLVGLLSLAMLSGCEQGRELWSSPGKGGDDASAEPVEVAEQSETERQLELERERAELARLEAEREAREQAEAEARRQRLEQGDALVEGWAERLAANKLDNGAFVEHEGLSEDDPWGAQLRISYTAAEDVDSQTLEVRSAGPNGSFDDEDDLLRTRETAIARSFWVRHKIWIIVGILWLGMGFVSAGGLRRRGKRRKGAKDEGLDAADVLISIIYILFAPLTTLAWIVLGILEFGSEALDVLD